MDGASLALGAIHPIFGIGNAVRHFYQGYHHVPEELEKLAIQADTWEAIITYAYRLFHGTHNPSDTGSIPVTVPDAGVKQLALCKKLLYQLSDRLKISPEAAKTHNWHRIKTAYAGDKA